MPQKALSHSQRQGTARQAKRHYDRTKRKVDPALAEAKKVRSSARWRKLRALKLQRDPVCQDPDFNHTHTVVAAREVDHIVPLRKDITQAYVYDNLQSLCTYCHARKTARGE